VTSPIAQTEKEKKRLGLGRYTCSPLLLNKAIYWPTVLTIHSPLCQNIALSTTWEEGLHLAADLTSSRISSYLERIDMESDYYKSRHL
jgi:hypothetical protein